MSTHIVVVVSVPGLLKVKRENLDINGLFIYCRIKVIGMYNGGVQPWPATGLPSGQELDVCGEYDDLWHSAWQH